MILYEVVAAVPLKLLDNYLEFLQSHALRVVESPGFLNFRIVHEPLNSDHEGNSVKVKTEYSVSSQSYLDDYFQNRAPKLRREAIDLFGDQISFERKIWIIASR